MSGNPFEQHLDKTPANYQPLTPLTFLERAAQVFPDHTAIIHGRLRRSYADFYARSRRLASALAAALPCHREGAGFGGTRHPDEATSGQDSCLLPREWNAGSIGEPLMAGEHPVMLKITGHAW